MTTIQSTTPTSPTSASRTELTQNFDTFLKLLTTQLQNQDPLKPLDPTEFVSQLTQFSELEQAVSQTEVLERIESSLASTRGLEEVSLLGKEIDAPTDRIAYSGNPVVLNYAAVATSGGVYLELSNDVGDVVARQQVDGTSGQLTWSGVTEAGTAVPGTDYQVQLVSANGVPAGTVSYRGVVQEVRLASGTPQLVLDTGQVVTMSDVKTVR